MSSTDDLRAAIEQAIADASHGVITHDAEADAVLVVLADPVHRLAILNLIGEVREVTAVEMEAGGPWWHERVAGHGDKLDGFVVVSRGEATDED